MKLGFGLPLIAAACLAFAGPAKADTYSYEIKAEIDFSGVDPTILQRANLGPLEVFYAVIVVDNPQYPGTPGTTHSHTPDLVEFEFAGQNASAPGNTMGAGGILGKITVGDQPLGATYNDFFGITIEPRALSGLPFGEIGRLIFQTRYANDTFDSVKLPESNRFMANLIRTSAGSQYYAEPHVELFVFRNGPGSGFDRATAPIRGLNVEVRVN